MIFINPKIDFAFIDANHKFTPTLKYFSWLAEKSHADTIIVLDDIHWSKQMEQAWLEVQNMPGVTITVDLLLLLAPSAVIPLTGCTDPLLTGLAVLLSIGSLTAAVEAPQPILTKGYY